MLSAAEIESFTADGFVAVRGAVPPRIVRACQDEIWAALGERGVRRGRDGAQWVNYRSRSRGLLALYLFTDVDARSAPTRVRPGSHADAARVLAPAGEEGMAWMEAAQRAARASASRPVELVTGQAGDVFLCHPFLVHAATWPHTGPQPRIIAQPGIALHSEFPLDGPLSPVEVAIAAAA